jgi:PAS domain S-box-containing protein
MSVGTPTSGSAGLLQRRLPPHPSSAGEARRMVGRLLAESGREDLADTGQLLVSEVVTNALVYAATPIDVCVQADEDGILVQVGDGSRHWPEPRSYGLTAHTGRGLTMLEDMSSAWGVVPAVGGKTVWFHLSFRSQAGEEPTEQVQPEEVQPEEVQPEGEGPQQAMTGPRVTVDVELLNVPLLLHGAWRQHAEAMLREYLLTSLDLRLDDDPLAVHAAAIDAATVLAEHIPEPEVGSRPEQVLDRAVEPQVSADSVLVPVPVSSVPHFHTLDATLEAAFDLAEEGRLLNPPLQPELRSLRRWMCSQVLDQSTGARPVAWECGGDAGPVASWALVWDATPVTRSAVAMVAADDTNRIIAVSAPALRLLGYDSAEQLVEHRLITLIPERYRQAHIAGFTMQQLTGHGPLIDNAVRVPALRGDGSEVWVELYIERQRARHGRLVYVATLRSPAG